MRKTQQFRNRMQAVLDIGISAVIMGAIGHAYSNSLSGAVAGAGIGAAWKGMAHYPTLREGTKAGKLERVINGPTEGLEEEVAQWRTPDVKWAEAVTMDMKTKPNWAERMKGNWIAGGLMFSWKVERERINWRWVNWMKQEQLVDFVKYFRYGKGQESPGIEVLRNSLLHMTPDDLRILKEKTVISEVADPKVGELLARKTTVGVRR